MQPNNLPTNLPMSTDLPQTPANKTIAWEIQKVITKISFAQNCSPGSQILINQTCYQSEETAK